MANNQTVAPEHTAARVALWRALHVLIDKEPHVLNDTLGWKLLNPPESWRDRPDMHPEGTKSFRASIVARARFIEDMVQDEMRKGVTQYVILGAGLDTFAQRRPEIASKIHVFEVDQPGPQKWKEERLREMGFSTPKWLHFVPVDFEKGESWWDKLIQNGFHPEKPAVVVSTGVAMYLTKEANEKTLENMAKLAPGSTFAMTFMLKLELLSPEDRAALEFTMKKAADAGTPILSLFSPSEIVAMGEKAGFKSSQYISGTDLHERYFLGRTDGLSLSGAENFLIART